MGHLAKLYIVRDAALIYVHFEVLQFYRHYVESWNVSTSLILRKSINKNKLFFVKLHKSSFYRIPQCGNYRIFLSLRFYVKSKLVNLRYSNLQFQAFQQIVRLWIINLCTFWRLEFTKLTKFRAPNMAKTAVLELLDSPKLISRKI